ncbi:unnamed protein product [Leuciscus chuanchicus]
MNDHRTSLQNGHDVDISHKDNDNTTEPQQPLLTDTISAEPCPQSSPQTDISELLQDSAPKDDFLENSQGSQDSISQPPITPEQQPLSPDTFSLSPATPLLCFSQKMEELVHAGTRLSHSFAASPQISTKKRQAPLPPKPAGPAHPPPASVRALRPLPQRQGPHPPPSARDSEDDISCSKIMRSYKQMRPATHEDSDLFYSENSSVDDSTDIQDDIRPKPTPFAMSEQHSTCATTFQKAKNTRARRKIAEHSDVFDSSKDELSEVSEEEYIPDTSEESSASDSSTSLTVSPKGKGKLQTLPVQCSSAENRSTNYNPQSSCDLGSFQSHGAASVPDSTSSVIIPAIIKKRDGLRMYSKRQHCFFCDSAFTKIARHLEHKHSNEVEVAKALSHPKGSKERQMQLEYLRNKGNFAYNATVINTGSGQMDDSTETA